MEEERVVKSVRNDVNRQINAELANQQKAASAAVEQIYAIRRVVEHYGMGGPAPRATGVHPPAGHLPRGVAEGARRAATPPLSKSAVYHRRPPPRAAGRRAGRGGVAPAAPSRW